MPAPTEPTAATLEALLAQAEAGDRRAARTLYATGPDWSDAPLALRFRLALGQLWFVLEHPAEFPDDAARELYSALLDRHADEPAQLAEVQAAGARLHQLEHDGDLPRAMVVRRPRHP
ncbi:MAG: hypothetical protein R3B06_23170 [Kofleriaceae bacterium]